MTRGAVALVAIAAVGCASHQRVGSVPQGPGPLVATYRAVFATEKEAPRRARLVLWAEMPDRLHAELVSPVGGVRLSLDAGDGRVSVVDTGEGIAYVGPAAPEAIEALTGVRVGVAEAVAALLEGRPPEGAEIERDGEALGQLPSRFSIASGAASLALERTHWERGRPGGATLGTGAPPQGMAVRPLAALGERAAQAGDSAGP